MSSELCAKVGLHLFESAKLDSLVGKPDPESTSDGEDLRYSGGCDHVEGCPFQADYYVTIEGGKIVSWRKDAQGDCPLETP